MGAPRRLEEGRQALRSPARPVVVPFQYKGVPFQDLIAPLMIDLFPRKAYNIRNFEQTRGKNEEADKANEISDSLRNVEISDGNAVGYTGCFPGGVQYSISSGSTNSGDISSIKIDSDNKADNLLKSAPDYSWNTRGINIVVYDNDSETIVDEDGSPTYQNEFRGHSLSDLFTILLCHCFQISINIVLSKFEFFIR